MLVSLLDSHPDLACFGELMRPTPEWMLRKGYRGALTTLERVDPKWRRDSVRFADPEGFVEEVFADLTDQPVVGFKLMLEQHRRYLLRVLEDPRYKKIVLYRENALAAFSSQKIAKATGQGNARIGMQVKRAKVDFRADEFKRFLKRRQKAYDEIDSALQANGHSYLAAEYLDLVAGRVTDRIMDFLGVDPGLAGGAETIKRNPSNLLDRFNNPRDVRAALDQIGRPEWSAEALA